MSAERCRPQMFAAVVAALAGIAQAGEPPPPPRAGVAEVTFVFAGGHQRTRRVAPGEWVPYYCTLAVPYRGGSVLRFEGELRRQLVSVDGGPPRPAWISVHKRDDLDALNQAIKQGARGFAVVCSPRMVAHLPLLPRGRDIALTVSGRLADFAPLAKQSGITGLSVSASGLRDLGPLAAFPDLTSLRLTGGADIADLRPLTKLSKLTWIRLAGFPNLEDLSPLADLPKLQGLRLWRCGAVSDLVPLAEARNLSLLTLYSCERVTDLRPLAKLRRLRVLQLRATPVADLGPLAGMTQLLELELAACKTVASLKPLAGLRHLDSLNISYCKEVSDLSPLAGLERLEQLSLYGCKSIADLRPLAACTRLKTVNLSGDNQVVDLWPLRHVIRRGAAVSVPDRLKPQLEGLRTVTDF